MPRLLTLLLLLPAMLFAQTPAPAGPTPRPQTATPAAAAPPVRAPARRPAATPRATPSAVLTDEQKTLYALGLLVQRNLVTFELDPSELAMVVRGMNEAAAGRPAVDLNEWGPRVQTLASARASRAAAREKANAVGYVARAGAEPGAVTTDSGLVFRELTQGTGALAKATDTVRVHYRGTLTNGTEFDSSYTRNEPAEFPLAGVIRCWTEGVQRMRVGGKAKLVCPADLAYGDGGTNGIPGGAALTFEVELLGIVGAPVPAN